MEDYAFDVSGILSEEEAAKLFEENETTTPPAQEDPVKEEANKTETQAEEKNDSPEKVGEEEVEIEENAVSQSDGSSPSVYSSIANALKNDGVFPDFEDSDIQALKTPEDFAELFEKAVANRLDERQKRIDMALGNGVEPDKVRMYEQTLQYLGSINEEALSSGKEEGENLRKQLIYNDLINKGYSEERAKREIEKSFKSGSDIDDAKDALEALNKFYKDGYEKVQNEAKARVEAQKEARKKDSEKFRKMILEDEVKIGDTPLDKRTRQQVFDAVSKPVYKDPDTGQLLTQVQKFQRENPLEFLKQLGMWYVLTDGGKDASGLVKKQARVEKNKNIRELERKINSSSFGADGSLRYMSGTSGDSDPLLSDGWKVDLG